MLSPFKSKRKLRSLVSSDFLRISLCQIPPGKETAIFQSIAEEQSNTICYLGLSEYDLVTLSPCDLDSNQFNNLWPYAPHLVGYNEVMCYSWKTNSTPYDKLNASLPARSISFLKINENIIKQLGLNAEAKIVSWLDETLNDSSNPSIQASVYSTFGWPEIAIIWGASDFTLIVDKIRKLRVLQNIPSVSELLSSHNTDNVTPIFTYSHSIPCVPVEITPFHIDRNLEVAADINIPFYARLFVMSAAGVEASIEKKITDRFQGQFLVTSSYGHHDLMIEPQKDEMSLKMFLEMLKFIRELGRSEIYFTEVQIVISNEDIVTEDFSNPSHLSNDEDLSAAFDIVRKLYEFESAFHNPLISFAPLLHQMLIRHQSVAYLDVFADLVKDLDGFLSRLLLQAELMLAQAEKIPVITTDLRKQYDVLVEAHRLFHFAFEQKINGVQIDILDGAQSFTRLRSASIQRLLTAANSIPNSLLSQFSIRSINNNNQKWWDGFVVFGYDSDVLRIDYGAMNIPAETLFCPAEWWSLGHETGHEFVDILGLLSKPEINYFVELALERNATTQTLNGGFLQRADDIEDLLEELIAEVFSFQFACNQNWDIYRDIVWEYLQNYLEGRRGIDRATSYIIRSLFVYFYHLEVGGALLPDDKVSDIIERGKQLYGYLYLSQNDEAHYRERKQSAEQNICHRAFAQYSSLEELINEFFFPQIIETAPKIAGLIEQVDPKTVAYWYELFEPLRSKLIRMFKNLGIDPKKHKSLPNLGKVQNALRKGLVCLEKTIMPIEIVLALKQEKAKIESGSPKALSKDDWNRAILTGLLSLWHLEKTSFQD